MIILSIDPGIEKVGYAFFNNKDKSQFKLLQSGLIKTKKSLSTQERIFNICEELNSLITKFSPKKIILEKIFFFKNQKTIISVAQFQGAVLYMAKKKKILCDFLTPLQIKEIITGYGNSDKKNVEKMIRLTFSLNNKKIEDDEIDAIACGLAYCYLNKNLIK